MESKYKAKPEQIIYGFLIDGAKEEEIEDFKKQLCEAKAINFRADGKSIEAVSFSEIKHRLKASSIKVIAIGHGYDNGTINGKYRVIDVIKDVGKELGDCSSRVSEFRLQVCNQAKFATKTDKDEKEVLDTALLEALKSYKSEHVIFCCPRNFSYIKGGSYQDTNASCIETLSQINFF